MGAWGTSSFDNDDAGDWLYEFEASDSLEPIQQAIDAAQEDYLEAPEGCAILAAAEVLLALIGQPRPGLPDSAKQWAQTHQHPDAVALVPAMADAVQAVLAEHSELRELWEEAGDDYEVWKRDVDELVNALV